MSITQDDWPSPMSDESATPTPNLEREQRVIGGQRVVGRSIRLNGHDTSVSLEDEFWEALREIARSKGIGLGRLAGQIDTTRAAGGVSSALRVFVLEHYRALRAAERSAAAEAQSQETPLSPERAIHEPWAGAVASPVNCYKDAVG